MSDKIEIELNRRHGKKHNSVPSLLLLCLLVLLPFVYYTVSRKQRIKAGKLDLEHSQTESIIYQQNQLRKLAVSKNARIVNGIVFTESLKEFPMYMVSLMTTDGEKQYWHVCGGTLITPNIVITAAHCRNTVKGAYIANGGKAHHGRKISDDKRRYYTIKEEDKYIHPKFDRKELLYDFMLIKLPIEIHEAPWKNEIFPKLHHYSSIPYEKESLMVMGWGRTSTKGPTSSLLLTANLDYVSNQQCKGIYGANMIDRSMLCAHSSKGRDACQGDSGGPLVMFKDDDTILLGLSSWGYVCAHPKYPGVYSRVSSSYGWITQSICTKLSPESCDDKSNLRTTFVDSGHSDSTLQTPSNTPTSSPTPIPTKRPTISPIIAPTSSPTPIPTKRPTISPTIAPTSSPTPIPTKRPTMSPTIAPTSSPTPIPTKRPTISPTIAPTSSPTPIPTKRPTFSPTSSPTPIPTKRPTFSPTTSAPSLNLSAYSHNPTQKPTKAPIEFTRNPTRSPSESKGTFFESFFSLDFFSSEQETNPVPTQWPTMNPTVTLSRNPTQEPSVDIIRSPTVPPTRRKSSNGSSSFTLDFFFPEENSNPPPTPRPTVKQSQATNKPTRFRPPPRPASSFNLDMFFSEENSNPSPTQRPATKVPATGTSIVGLDSMLVNNNIQRPETPPPPTTTSGAGFGLDSINFVSVNNPSSSIPPTKTEKGSSGGFSLNNIGMEPP